MLCGYRGMVQECNQRSYLVDQAAVSRDCYLSIGTPESRLEGPGSCNHEVQAIKPLKLQPLRDDLLSIG